MQEDPVAISRLANQVNTQQKPIYPSCSMPIPASDYHHLYHSQQIQMSSFVLSQLQFIGLTSEKVWSSYRLLNPATLNYILSSYLFETSRCRLFMLKPENNAIASSKIKQASKPQIQVSSRAFSIPLNVILGLLHMPKSCILLSSCFAFYKSGQTTK